MKHNLSLMEQNTLSRLRREEQSLQLQLDSLGRRLHFLRRIKQTYSDRHTHDHYQKKMGDVLREMQHLHRKLMMNRSKQEAISGAEPVKEEA
ncbi:hypothetical protein [Alkalicoccus luteus]|uniref:Uncharacterized protein n=1 Tax=Alkalicoccus luteus TaxID=1237094 RepID=A0A969TXQ4_9BACI|nr:hypothetical protein [Alkalicoccus luteus]NJP38439.1 hypothetical protein [Alkalicoccus luteus]